MGVTQKGIIPWLAPITCGICKEHLGSVFDAEGYTAEWWAAKALQEHAAEYH